MDIEKTMEFILSVQARLEASVQQHDERIAELKASVATVTDLVGRLAQTEIRLVERIEAATGAMTTGFQELRGLHANTESKLNALIDTVDKLVRRNGHPA
jgi:hypothetical protein